MSGIKNIPGGELVYAAATFSVAIAQEYDLDDINILAGFFFCRRRRPCGDRCTKVRFSGYGRGVCNRKNVVLWFLCRFSAGILSDLFWFWASCD